MFNLKALVLGLLFATVGGGAALSKDILPPPVMGIGVGPAYFRVWDPGHCVIDKKYKDFRDFTCDSYWGKKGFVISSSNPQFIAQARDAIKGKYRLGAKHVAGIVVPKKAAYNASWNFILEPSSLGLFQNNIEICDDTPWGVDRLRNEWPKSVKVWCPWNSEIFDEITPQ